MDAIAQQAFAHPVSKTLMIPLWIRAAESQRRDAIVQDPTARDIVSRLARDFQADFSLVKDKKASHVGVSIRTLHFDDLVRKALASSPQPVVVHIGCGLDTRFQRTDDGKGIQVELDLPPVMALREQFLPASRRNPSIAMSALDTAWMDDLRSQYPKKPFVFIAEGVLPYFKEGQVRRFISDLAERFPGSKLHFDACSSWMANISNLAHGALHKRRAGFRLGIDEPQALCCWDPRLRFDSVRYYLQTHHRRWGWRNVYRLVPPLAKTFKMLSYSIRP